MLSTTSQYALRALTELAGIPGGEAMLGRDLAELADIPANYLSKVMLAMRNAGLVTTARGSGGGYRLLKSPDEIHLIEVVGIFDAPQVKPICLLGKGDCSDRDPCSAHTLWRDVRSAYIQFLETTTLADIASAPKALTVEESQQP